MTTSWKLKLKVESVEVLQGCGTMEIAKLKTFGRVGHYDIGGFFLFMFFLLPFPGGFVAPEPREPW